MSEAIQTRFSEDISGRFLDADISVTFVIDPGWVIGGRESVLAASGYNGYSYSEIIVKDKTRSGNLTTITAETLFRAKTKQRVTSPFGFAVPLPQTPKHAFAMLMDYFGLPYDPLPEIRLRLSGANVIIPTVPAVIATWSKDAKPPTILEVIEAFLRPYDGYVLRLNGGIYFKLTEPYWANTSTDVVPVTDFDVLEDGLSVAEESVTVINYATVKSKGYDFVTNQLLGARVVFDYNYAGPYYLIRDVLKGPYSASDAYSVGDAVTYNGTRYKNKTGVNVLPTGAANSAANWEVSAKNDYLDAQGTLEAPIDPGTVTVDAITVSLSGSMTYDYAAGLANDGTAPINMNLQLGAPGDVITVALPNYDLGSGGSNLVHDNLVIIWQGDRIQFAFQPTHENPIYTGSGVLVREYRIFAQITGSKFQEGGTTSTGIFGQDPGVSPSLQASQDTYGVRELSIDTGGLKLNATEALEMALGIVERGVMPDLVYNVRLVPPYAAQSSNIGELIQLPDGKLGTLESWTYSDSQSPSSSTSSCSARVRVDTFNGAPPPAPITMTIQAEFGNPNARYIAVYWPLTPGAIWYEVQGYNQGTAQYVSFPAGDRVPSQKVIRVTEFQHFNIVSGRGYRFRVRAWNNNGSSNWTYGLTATGAIQITAP